MSLQVQKKQRKAAMISGITGPPERPCYIQFCQLCFTLLENIIRLRSSTVFLVKNSETLNAIAIALRMMHQ